MTALLVVVALVAVAATVALAVLVARLHRERTTLGDERTRLEQRVHALEADLATAGDELAAARAAAEAAGEEAAAAQAEVAATRAEADATAERAAEAEQRVSDLDARIAALRAAGGDPALLWSLELERTARRWRHSVAPGPATTTPLATSTNVLRTAVEIVAAAVNEESGTAVRVAWELGDDEVPDAVALQVLRTADELVAAAAMVTDHAVLTVSRDEGGVRVAIVPGAAGGTAMPADAGVLARLLAAHAQASSEGGGASVVVPADPRVDLT